MCGVLLLSAADGLFVTHHHESVITGAWGMDCVSCAVHVHGPCDCCSLFFECLRILLQHDRQLVAAGLPYESVTSDASIRSSARHQVE